VARKDRRGERGRRTIPLALHGVIEYGEGVLTILAPFLFGYSESTDATLLSVLIGAAVLVLAVVTVSPAGISRSLPLASHVVLDYVLVAIYLSFPFIFGFSDNSEALAYFLIVGVAHLLMTVSTRFRKPERAD
jgi:SPW repeat